MTRRRYIILAAAAVLAIGLGWAGAIFATRDGQTGRIELTALDPARLLNLPAVTHSISVIESRVAENPGSFIDYTLLGDLHLARARETGDVDSLLRAGAAFERALEINPAYPAATAGLGSALYNQHRFEEAIAWSERVPVRNAARTRAVATIADAQLALGRYDQAEAGYGELSRLTPGPANQARLAQLNYLKGNVDEAIRLARSAATAAYTNGANAETMAWYLARVADLFFGAGDLDAAAAHYQSALKMFDRHYISLAGLAKVRAAQGRSDEAISLYRKAADIVPQPSILAGLGDVLARTGRAGEAQLQYDTVGLIGRLAEINKAVYNRELVLFYAAHNIRAEEALRLAQAEIAVRQDVHGYDALAWALYRNGRAGEAADAIQRALSLGTPDASFHYHAGLIYHALGRNAEAQAALETALNINPHFSLLEADGARATLAAIKRDAARGLAAAQSGPGG